MSWFVKRETFNAAFRGLDASERSALLQAHKAWVATLRAGGQALASGFLVDTNQRSGGGGLLLLEASSYSTALEMIQQDPLIAGGWVDWQLHQWIAAEGELGVA